MDWPNHFPEDCPPNATKDADGEEVYRLVDQNPPSDLDFISHRLRYPKREFSDECKACGLSIFTNVEDSIKLRKKIARFKGYFYSYRELAFRGGQNTTHTI